MCFHRNPFKDNSFMLSSSFVFLLNSVVLSQLLLLFRPLNPEFKYDQFAKDIFLFNRHSQKSNFDFIIMNQISNVVLRRNLYFCFSRNLLAAFKNLHTSCHFSANFGPPVS